MEREAGSYSCIESDFSGDTFVSFFFESVLLNAFSMHFKQCTTMEEVYPMI